VNDPTPKQLEELLMTGFGASGASVTEKLTSVEARLPAPLIVQLKAVFATARQLETGETVDLGSYRRMLQSSAEQLELLAVPRAKAALETAPSSPGKPVTNAKSRGVQSRAPKPSRLKWWLHETRKAIPARAYRLSRTWRVLGTVLGLFIGAGVGWLLSGIGGAIAGALGLAIIAFLSLSESALARGLWAQTNFVSGLFALLRLLGRAALAVLAIVLVGLIVFFVTRFWNVR
jgi:hypothetical protein